MLKVVDAGGTTWQLFLVTPASFTCCEIRNTLAALMSRSVALFTQLCVSELAAALNVLQVVRGCLVPQTLPDNLLSEPAVIGA